MVIGGIEIAGTFICKTCLEKLKNENKKLVEGPVIWPLYRTDGVRMHCEKCNGDFNELIEILEG